MLLNRLTGFIQPSSRFLLTFENTLRARDVLMKLIQMEVHRGNIPKVAHEICSRINPAASCGACIQALYTLRLSEAKQVDVERILRSQSQVILQSKTKVSKFLRSFDCKELIADCDITSDVNPFPMSDSNYINAVKKAIPNFIREILIDEANASHVFRHLQASFLKSKNVSTDVIRTVLGHTNDSSMQSYLHTQLINYFITNP